MLEKEGYVAELNGKYLGKDFSVSLLNIDKAFLWKTKEQAEVNSKHYGIHILEEKKLKGFNILHVRLKTKIEFLDGKKEEK